MKHASVFLRHAGPPCPEDQLCLQSHYAAIVEASKEVEIYQLGDVDCPSCLRRMAEKHEALAEAFRARLAALGGPT